MDGTTPITHAQRRSVAWILWSTVASCALVLIVVVLWFFLPRWMPEAVIRWSPWVEPVLRAVTRVEKYSDDFDDRVDAWGPKCLPAFAQALRTGSPAVRCEVVRGLCQLAYRPDVRPVVMPMLFGALADQDRDVLIATLDGLGMLAGEQDQPRIPGLAQRLAPFLRSDDAEVRQEAVVALLLAFGAFPADATAMPMLLATLADVRPEVRDAAAAVIARVEDTQSARIVIATLEAPDIRLRRAAVAAAGATQLSEMIEPLSRLYATADADMRAEILRAFWNIGNSTTLPFIIRASADPDRVVRLLAVRRLGVFAEVVAFTELDGKRELAEAIAAALQDADREVASAAEVAAMHLAQPTHRKVPPGQPLPRQ